MANGFVEVFQKVLIKLVHMAIAEKEPREMLDQYLISYKAAPHKTTGKSLYQLLFRRKMKTKLPRLMGRPSQGEDGEVREKHDERKKRQKESFDKKNKVKKKDIKEGDKVLIQQKTMIKPPWEIEPYQVVEVKGAKVKIKRGEMVKERTKTNVKIVTDVQKPIRIAKSMEREEPDLDVDLDKVRTKMSGEQQQQEEPAEKQSEEEDEAEQHED